MPANVGSAVIDCNEGGSWRHCLNSIEAAGFAIYVDSGSVHDAPSTVC